MRFHNKNPMMSSGGQLHLLPTRSLSIPPSFLRSNLDDAAWNGPYRSVSPYYTPCPIPEQELGNNPPPTTQAVADIPPPKQMWHQYTMTQKILLGSIALLVGYLVYDRLIKKS